MRARREQCVPVSTAAGSGLLNLGQGTLTVIVTLSQPLCSISILFRWAAQCNFGIRFVAQEASVELAVTWEQRREALLRAFMLNAVAWPHFGRAVVSDVSKMEATSPFATSMDQSLASFSPHSAPPCSKSTWS